MIPSKPPNVQRYAHWHNEEPCEGMEMKVHIYLHISHLLLRFSKCLVGFPNKQTEIQQSSTHLQSVEKLDPRIHFKSVETCDTTF